MQRKAAKEQKSGSNSLGSPEQVSAIGRAGGGAEQSFEAAVAVAPPESSTSNAALDPNIHDEDARRTQREKLLSSAGLSLFEMESPAKAMLEASGALLTPRSKEASGKKSDGEDSSSTKTKKSKSVKRSLSWSERDEKKSKRDKGKGKAAEDDPTTVTSDDDAESSSRSSDKEGKEMSRRKSKRAAEEKKSTAEEEQGSD